MDLGLAIAVLLALAFATTNGLHDASNALATLGARARRLAVRSRVERAPVARAEAA
jgi:phosphate/sulfate permease